MLCVVDLSFTPWRSDYVVYHSGLGAYANKHYTRLDDLLFDYSEKSLCFLFPENSFDYQYQRCHIVCDSFLDRDYFMTLYKDFLPQSDRGALVQGIWFDWCVDSLPTDRLLWKQWDISWTFLSYRLQPPITYYMPSEVFFSSLVLPESFPLLYHLAHKLWKQNFVMLHLGKVIAKVCYVVDGCYSVVDSITMGKNYFFRMLHDAGIQHINLSDLSFSNPLANKLIQEVYTFYITTLFDRLDSVGVFVWPLIVVSDLMTYEFFADVFCVLGKSRYSTYIIPFDASLVDNDFDLIHAKLMDRYYSFFLDHSLSI